MKKYFSLFAISFIVLEACLIAGSSSSYGMEPEFDEVRQNIVISNSQGQKIRKVSLHPMADPMADNRFQRYGKAPITILLGTSTAGKTALINSIRMTHPTIKDYSGDLRFYINGGYVIKYFFPEEYETLNTVVPHEEIFKVCSGDKIKPGNYLPEQLDLAKNALQKLEDEFEFDDENFDWTSWRDKEAEQLILDSMKGAPIILDHVCLWGIPQIFSRNFYANLNIVITFCPLQEVSKRLKRRNEEAEQFQQPTNVREVDGPLWNFTDLYKKRESQNEPLLQILTREEALSAFRLHITNSAQEEKFLKALGFSSLDDKIEITTRAPYYHSILNTKTHAYKRFR